MKKIKQDIRQAAMVDFSVLIWNTTSFTIDFWVRNRVSSNFFGEFDRDVLENPLKELIEQANDKYIAI